MVLHPVGPLPASTYWRRRLVLLVALVLLLLVVRSVLGGGGGRTPTASTSPTPPPTAGATTKATAKPTRTSAPVPPPTPTPTAPAGPVSCSDQALSLTTSSDAATYPVGTSPRFTVTVKNSSGATCRRDLGPLQVVVRSGADRIWASTDCAPRATAAPMTLRAGASLEATKTWDGKRSVPGCSGTRAAVRPGTYTVRATVGTLTSTVTVFRVTAAG